MVCQTPPGFPIKIFLHNRRENTAFGIVSTTCFRAAAAAVVSFLLLICGEGVPNVGKGSVSVIVRVRKHAEFIVVLLFDKISNKRKLGVIVIQPLRRGIRDGL